MLWYQQVVRGSILFTPRRCLDAPAWRNYTAYGLLACLMMSGGKAGKAPNSMTCALCASRA